jgi:hypothetical protein
MVDVSPTLEPFARVKTLFADKQYLAALDVIAEALRNPDCNDRVGLLMLQARMLVVNLGRQPEGLEVLEAANRQYPDNEAVMRLLARFRHGMGSPLARYRHVAGMPTAAFNLYKRLYRAGDPTGEAVQGLFTILMEARRYSAAARLAPQILATDPPSAAQARDLAELRIAQRDVDGAQAMIEVAGRGTGIVGLDQLRIVAEKLKAELAAGDTMAGRRHLAIGGAAFCGSTTLGIILGSMPGFAFAGETTWLTTARTSTGGLESILGGAVPILRWPIACRVCHRDCDYFDIPFRLALAGDNTGWYAKIADRLGTKNLVTSDKNIQHYEEHDPLFRFDYILSYKEPTSYLRSTLKQFLRQPGQVATVTAAWASETLDRWADNYMRQLKAIRPAGRRVVLNWDGLVAEPDFHLRRLGEILSIPLGPETVKHIRLGHFIGGNIGVDVDALRADPVLTLRTTNAPQLPPEIHQVALTHEAAGRVSRRLANEYRRDFRAPT